MQEIDYKNYKSFRKQFLECKKYGNLIEIDASIYGKFPKTILVCLRHKCVCHSKACLNERIGKLDEKPIRKQDIYKWVDKIFEILNDK